MTDATIRQLRNPHLVFLLGIPFHDVTMEETLEWIDALVARRQPCYLATANLDFAAQASRDVELQRILFDAELVLCDSTPLIWASRWLDAPLHERVAGTDLLPSLLAHCTRREHSVFFLGATHEVLTAAVVRCRAEYPGIDICGVYAPPSANLLDLDHEEIAGRIAESQPDILLVAMGSPKQEKWIYMNYQRLGVSVSIGIGAGLDFMAGKSSRTPAWMREGGSGGRFWGQHLDLLFFVTALRRQRRLLKRRGSLFGRMDRIDRPATRHVVQVKWSGRIDAATAATYAVQPVEPEEGKPNVVIDCSEVSFVDSAGLGLFIQAYRACHKAGGTLVVLNPSEVLTRMLSVLQLTRVFPIARSEEEIPGLLPSAAPVRADVRHFSNTAILTVEIPGDITAATVANCEAAVLEKWNATPWAGKLQIDLSNVSFLNSSGLGFLVKALRIVKKREGATLELLNISDNVSNVIKLANLHGMFGLSA